MESCVSSGSVNLCKALVSGVKSHPGGDLDTLTCLLIWMSLSPTETICVKMLFKTVHIQRVQSMVVIFLDMPINYHF